VAVQDATLLQDAAESLANDAAPRLASWLDCNLANDGEPACAKAFIQSFGRRAYRRPLSQDEVERLLSLQVKARTSLKLDFQPSLLVVIEALLQSPSFLYHWETDADFKPGDAATPLGPYQLASRLSYFLWGSMPDDELFRAADEGRLLSTGGLESEVQRMLQSPKARDAVANFVQDWLDLDLLAARDKQAKAYPMWTQDTGKALLEELTAFVSHAVFETDGHLKELFANRNAVVDERTAWLYGVSGKGKVELPVNERRGLLTRPAFLALNGASDGSHPVRRGHALFAEILCGELPPTPPDVPEAKPPQEGISTRQRFADHASNPCARSCHGVLDPLGFLFEHYDGIGQYRVKDAGLAVNAQADVELDGEVRSFANALAFSDAIGNSADVQGCFVRQWFRYALRRHELDVDDATLARLTEDFSADEARIPKLMKQIALSIPFRFHNNR
jgi:hypothetical protein